MPLLVTSAIAAALVVVVLVVPPWSVPARHGGGPTAICRDAWRSFSRHHSGACAWHGGVLAFGGEAPRPAGEPADAVVHAAQQAERRACAGVTVDEAWPDCAAR